MFLLFQGGIFRFHVCFQGCKSFSFHLKCPSQPSKSLLYQHKSSEGHIGTSGAGENGWCASLRFNPWNQVVGGHPYWLKKICWKFLKRSNNLRNTYVLAHGNCNLYHLHVSINFQKFTYSISWLGLEICHCAHGSVEEHNVYVSSYRLFSWCKQHGHVFDAVMPSRRPQHFPDLCVASHKCWFVVMSIIQFIVPHSATCYLSNVSNQHNIIRIKNDNSFLWGFIFKVGILTEIIKTPMVLWPGTPISLTVH